MSTPADGIKQPYCPATRAARRFGDAPFLVGPDATISFNDFAQRVGRLTDKLRRDGIERRQSVALVLPTGPDLLALLAAVWRMGAIAFPLNPAAPWEYTVARIRDLGCVMTVVPQAPAEPSEAREAGLGSILAALQPNRITQARIRHGSHTPAVAILTSGSGGAPKAAVLSLVSMTLAAQRANRRMELERGGRYLLNLPLHHISGMSVFMRCLEAGAQCLLPGAGERTVDAIVRTRPTHLSLVAAQLRRVLEQPEALDALRAAKCVLLGGGPVTKLLLQRAFDAGVPLMNSYGMTETSAMTCSTRLEADFEELCSVGRPMLQDTVRVNEHGRVEVRGNTRFVGYLHGGVLDKPGGWFDTGDLGHFDEQGRLHIDGRADRMFIVGGENVRPEAVEAELCKIPGVTRAMVVPVPDPVLECMPVAFVELETGFLPPPLKGDLGGCVPVSPAEKTAHPAIATLLAACAERLPRHAMPRYFFPWPEEMVPGIKPRPAEMQQRAAEMVRGYDRVETPESATRAPCP
jgi:O-succinylbenzoic acid--CoA ligase